MCTEDSRSPVGCIKFKEVEFLPSIAHIKSSESTVFRPFLRSGHGLYVVYGGLTIQTKET